MKSYILRYFLSIAFLVLFISMAISSTLISQSMLNITKQDMLSTLKLVNYKLDYQSDLEAQLKELNTLAYLPDTRISIITTTGDVLADTTDNKIDENHLERKEIKEAMKEEVGYARRKSETTGKRLLYVAYRQGSYILRLAIPYNGMIDQYRLLIPAYLFSFLISICIAYVLSRRLALKISQPLGEISHSLSTMSSDFQFDLHSYEFQEFNIIVDTIDQLSLHLHDSIKELNMEREKILEIMKQMNEGFIILDEEGKILSMNPCAKTIVGSFETGDCLLPHMHEESLVDALKDPTQNKEIRMEHKGRIYECYLSKIKLGTSLLFVDVTDKQKAEQMRQDFFSNVSHELKTPLTAIKGYSDLMVEGVIQNDQQKTKMLEKIQQETNNMMNLINDILLLSRLEHDEIKVDMIPVKMKIIVNDVLDSHALLLNEKHIVTKIISDQDDSYTGNYKQLFTLLNNLISNAIKYNKDGGTITITLKKEEPMFKIVVEDTGIGIPEEDQSHVFERFYRVDKGRSKQYGGTGLGLAIVKHIVSYYHGTLHLTSKVQEGTKIEIELPM